MNEPNAEDVKFLELVLIFQQAAWQGLGKIQDPGSGKTEPNLPQASHAIDMLAMLKQKTSGNLSDPEEKLLANALTQLRLNFVEAQKDQASTKSDEPEQKAAEKPAEPAEDSSPGDSPEAPK